MTSVLLLTRNAALPFALGSAGFEVRQVTGESDVRWDQDNMPADVVLLDVDVPSAAALLIEGLARSTSDVRVLLLANSHTGWRDVIASPAQGVTVLPLPLTMPRLVESITTVLSGPALPGATEGTERPVEEPTDVVTDHAMTWGPDTALEHGEGHHAGTVATAPEHALQDPQSAAPDPPTDPVDDVSTAPIDTEQVGDAPQQQALPPQGDDAEGVQAEVSEPLAGTWGVPSWTAPLAEPARPADPVLDLHSASAGSAYSVVFPPAAWSVPVPLDEAPQGGPPAADLVQESPRDETASDEEVPPGHHEQEPTESDHTEPAPLSALTAPAALVDSSATTTAPKLRTGPEPPAPRPHSLVRSLTAEVDQLYSVPQTADVVLEEAVILLEATAGALLLRDGLVWRVSAGRGLRPLEYRLQLEPADWIIEEVSRSAHGVLIAGGLDHWPQLYGVPMSGAPYLLAAPVTPVAGVLLLSRNDAPFDEDDLTALLQISEEAGPALADAMAVRHLARLLEDFCDRGEQHQT